MLSSTPPTSGTSPGTSISRWGIVLYRLRQRPAPMEPHNSFPEYWNEKEGKKRITIEEWLSKAPPEIRENPIISTLNNNENPVSPAVMNKILSAPIWQISEARIHEAKEIQTPQKPSNGYRQSQREIVYTK